MLPQVPPSGIPRRRDPAPDAATARHCYDAPMRVPPQPARPLAALVPGALPWLAARVPSALPCLACLVFAMGCGSTQPRAATDFWSESEPDPIVVFEPSFALAKAATSSQDEIDATVADHGPARRLGADFTLDLRTAAGDVLALHYRIGAHRQIPVQRGDAVHVASWLRFLPNRDVAAQGLAITKKRPEGPLVLALVDVQNAVPRPLLPASLATVVATDAMAWQTSERLGTECYIAIVHQQFSIGVDPSVRTRDAPPRLVPPGARLRLWDGRTTYDVVLIDNRRTLNTTCVPEPPPWQAWAAIWTPDQGPPPIVEKRPASQAPIPKPDQAPPKPAKPDVERRPKR